MLFCSYQLKGFTFVATTTYYGQQRSMSLDHVQVRAPEYPDRGCFNVKGGEARNEE